MKAFLFALLACILGNAAAQTYPAQPVRLIAPFPPGGSVDIVASLDRALGTCQDGAKTIPLPSASGA